MKTDEVKVGEEFKAGKEHYKKTKDGIIKQSDGEVVSKVSGKIIMERSLLNG